MVILKFLLMDNHFFRTTLFVKSSYLQNYTLFNFIELPPPLPKHTHTHTHACFHEMLVCSVRHRICFLFFIPNLLWRQCFVMFDVGIVL